MSNDRRRFTAQQKAEVVPRHLKEKVAIRALAEELSIQPSQIYQWVNTLLDQAEHSFDRNDRRPSVSQRAEAKIVELKDQRMKTLEEKPVDKNVLIAELMEENVKAEKAIGTFARCLGAPRYSRRDRGLHEVLVRSSS